MSILGSINTLVDVDSDSDSPVHKLFSVGFRDGASEADTGIWQGVRIRTTPVLWAYLTVSMKRSDTQKRFALKWGVSVLQCS